ncbi:MAG: hypothetical protein LBV16_03285 [Elusimicrobiota bacterium]|jgi:acetyl-CoA carboxylase biotin carboxyl carrier protein|nr:hypothetical protein [Elusimicrobiota bacterium]
METQDLKKFLKSIRQTDIEELKYQSGGDSIYFKKSQTGIGAASKTQSAHKSVKPAASSIISDKEQDKVLQNPSIVSIKSIMVGTFSDILGGDGLPLIREGVKITSGQKVGQIEAMKIIKDIVCDVEGIIVKAFVSNGAAVEYGQEMFLIDTKKEALEKTGDTSVQ